MIRKTLRVGRLCICARLSREVWYNSLATGDRVYSLFKLGWYFTSPKCDTRVYTLTLLWVSVQWCVL
jgi:hypothetical protein